jgi:hypothetical protein
MASIYCWWLSLSGESKAAIIAAIIGPITVGILGVPMILIRQLYIRVIEKLDAARDQIHTECALALRTRIGGPISDDPPDPISTERLAKKAKVPLWLVNRAIRWGVRAQRFGLR